MIGLLDDLSSWVLFGVVAESWPLRNDHNLPVQTMDKKKWLSESDGVQARRGAGGARPPPSERRPELGTGRCQSRTELPLAMIAAAKRTPRPQRVCTLFV